MNLSNDQNSTCIDVYTGVKQEVSQREQNRSAVICIMICNYCWPPLKTVLEGLQSGVYTVSHIFLCALYEGCVSFVCLLI